MKKTTHDFLRIAVIFSLVFLAGLVLVEVLAQTGALVAYARSVAAQTSAVSSMFGIEHTLNGLNIEMQSRTLVIVAECTAIFLMIAYAALILAYPFSIEIKVLALFAGLIFIYLLNLARLVLTVALSDRVSNTTFSFMHNIFFQGLMVFVLLGMWAMLLSFDKTGTFPREALTFFGTVIVALFVFEGLVVVLDRLSPTLFPLSEMVYLPPALAVISCTRGRTPAQKLVLFASMCLVFWGGVQLQGVLNVALADGTIPQTTATLWLSEIVYGLSIVGVPLAGIVLSAGAKPQRLWSK